MSKHMDLNDRNQIYIGLEAGKSFGEISRELGKARSTIAREVKHHRIVWKKGAVGRVKNQCIHRSNCKLFGICENKPDCTRKCSTCSHCNKICHDFLEERCPKLEMPPYVCNGCSGIHVCTLNKWQYSPSNADQEYRTILKESREGFNLTEAELKSIDECISPLIQKGQSIHHACIHNRDSIIVSERTVERLISDCTLTARNIDRQRACKLKPRKNTKKVAKVERCCRNGRTYQDYLAYGKKYPDTPVVQMDSVIGRVGGKVLLTFIFPKAELMLAFLRDSNTSQSVIDCINRLYDGLGHDDFCKLFPVLLTDNGSEFSHPTSIEFFNEVKRRTQVFYCDPMASYQKPQVERNHEFIRLVLPQGTSFDTLTQSAVDCLMSHINSYSRKGLGDKSPFEMFAFLYGDALLEKLLLLVCQQVVPHNNIILKPSLLK